MKYSGHFKLNRTIKSKCVKENISEKVQSGDKEKRTQPIVFGTDNALVV